MEQYIKIITPIIKNILQLTKEGKIKWERSGTATYRCIAEETQLCLEISKFSRIPSKGAVSITLISEDNTVFKYKRDILQQYPIFDSLLEELYVAVEEANAEDVKNMLNSLVLSVTNNNTTEA